ncbi:ABC transporter permease [Glutamicibacter sp. NPDC087344]|uniref:ABC transporter permease n=1 Tax=Glutamicibacter sp. NPDC087344 TaxID=3363994 RepID=UPI003825AD99
MLKTVGQRLLMSVPLILLVSAVTFVLQALVPGDPARTLLGVNAGESEYLKLRESLQLDEPFITRYGDYLAGLLHGDMGTSIFTSIPVTTSILQRLPVTLALMAGAVVLAAVIGILLGVWSAVRGGALSKALDGLAMVGFAIPNFWLGLLLVSAFAMTIPLFPATGYEPLAYGFSPWLLCLVLPWIALSLNGVATIAKVTRESMLTSLNTDYIRTLRAAGVGRGSLVWKHALRNAGIPVSTMVGLTMIHCISGTIFVENVFALPGLGSLAVSAINNHDMPVTQGVVLTYTLLVVFINIAVDLAYTVLNPKVRVS